MPTAVFAVARILKAGLTVNGQTGFQYLSVCDYSNRAAASSVR